MEVSTSPVRANHVASSWSDVRKRALRWCCRRKGVGGAEVVQWKGDGAVVREIGFWGLRGRGMFIRSAVVRYHCPKWFLLELSSLFLGGGERGELG